MERGARMLRTALGPAISDLLRDASIVEVMLNPDGRIGDTGGGFRRLIQIVFGISIAFAASSFFLLFFSFGGGSVI